MGRNLLPLSLPEKLAIRYFNKIYGLGISFDCINGQSGSFLYTVWVGNRCGFDEWNSSTAADAGERERLMRIYSPCASVQNFTPPSYILPWFNEASIKIDFNETLWPWRSGIVELCWSQVVKVQNLKARKENEIIESTIGEWETISSLVCGNHRKKNALAHLHNHLPKHNTVRCLPGPAVREKLKIRIVISAVLNSANVPASFYFLISAFFLLSSLVLFILHCARLCMEFII